MQPAATRQLLWVVSQVFPAFVTGVCISSGFATPRSTSPVLRRLVRLQISLISLIYFSVITIILPCDFREYPVITSVHFSDHMGSNVRLLPLKNWLID